MNTKSILITQTLQNNFVKPLAAGEALPNQLHVGREEARRLVGNDITQGPIGRFMSWVDDQKASLSTIHIRDWHNADSVEQASHLKQFGLHCIENTLGADFIFPVLSENVTIVNSTTLNDFEGTGLLSALNGMTGSTDKKVRIGIIGVWTEAKVLFLAYELATRFPQCEIAVCSALTASSSRSQHFLALQQLQRIVGVRVIDSIGAFVNFLVDNNNATLDVLPSYKDFNNSLTIHADGDICLNKESEQLIRYLFRDCQNIRLKVLDGGFSGNLVAGVNSIDIHGHEQTPHVVKIGPRDLMARERTAFEQIESVLGNNAPAIADYVDGQTKGALKYRYAAMSGGEDEKDSNNQNKVRSLQHYIQQIFKSHAVSESESLNKIRKYLNAVFDQQLGRLYRAAINEKQDILQYYCFDSSWADSVKQKIIVLIGECSDSDEHKLPGNKKIPNLYRFYKYQLDKLLPMLGDYPFSFVHGDLNGANVIVDSQDNVWLIDFFHTHRGHVLKDFAKLENDLLYIYTPVESEADLQLAYAFSDFILNLKSFFTNLPELPDQFAGTQFQHTYAILRHIRELAKKVVDTIVGDAQNELNKQWLVAQLRYAVHTIGFDEPNELQRIWALMSAASITVQLKNEDVN